MWFPHLFSHFLYFFSKVKLSKRTKPLWLHNKVKSIRAWSGEPDYCTLQLNKIAESSTKMQTTMSLLAHKGPRWLPEPCPCPYVFSKMWACNYYFRKMPPKATVMSSESAVWSATCKSNKQRENPAQPWHSYREINGVKAEPNSWQFGFKENNQNQSPKRKQNCASSALLCYFRSQHYNFNSAVEERR